MFMLFVRNTKVSWENSLEIFIYYARFKELDKNNN